MRQGSVRRTLATGSRDLLPRDMKISVAVGRIHHASKVHIMNLIHHLSLNHDPEH